MTNRDLSYPRVVLNLVRNDIQRAIEKNPEYKEEGLSHIAACDLAGKILELYENYDAVEMVDHPPHLNSA